MMYSVEMDSCGVRYKPGFMETGTGFASEIRGATILVLLMEGIYK
jgi:hypothetical protein